MVLGGDPEDRTGSEMVKLINQGHHNCSKPGDFPDGKDLGRDAVGALIDGTPTVCGGIDGGRDCHGYSFETGTWNMAGFSMSQARAEAAGMMTTASSSWMIIGGRTPEGTGLSDSEILENGQFTAGPLWPIRFWGHCAIPLNGSHGFVAGGRNSEFNTRSTYTIEFATGYWIFIGRMGFDRSGHVCGAVAAHSRRGVEVVAAGGRQLLQTEIYSMDTFTWRDGPSLPYEMDRAAAVKVSLLLIWRVPSLLPKCTLKCCTVEWSAIGITSSYNLYRVAQRNAPPRSVQACFPTFG